MANEQLKAFVERIERLEEEKKALADDIRSIYAEAKSNGFDTKALRTIIKMRKQDANERAEQEAIVETYAHALGMLSDTPLGQAAVGRATKHPKVETDYDKVRRLAADPLIRKAFKKLGQPVDLTDEEKAKGYTAVFEKNGSRMAFRDGVPIGQPS